MQQPVNRLILFFRYGATLAVVLLGLVSIIGTGSSSSSSTDGEIRTGAFVNSPVEGLYYSASPSGLGGYTDADGFFEYEDGDEVSFSVGDLLLGSTPGRDVITPADIVPGASDITNRSVINIARLLQTLDADGDNNNGILITPDIANAVSMAGPIDFDQAPEDFGADPAVADLIAELNTENLFTDDNPLPRPLKSADQATQSLGGAMGERVVTETAYGQLRGYGPDENTWQWLGVPYAKPPVGELRWRPPEAPEPWEGIREAVSWGNQAAQNPSYAPFGEGGMGEDSLYLNITAPRDAEDLPVMVWFHGGGFGILTGNTKAFNNPNSLPAKDVILISVNHRLGPFGYLAHPQLSEESDYGGSGNYGQMDLVAALAWIQENIEAFGGNPDNVTIFGESGGGGKVQHLLASPHAEGLFHRAVIQSGMYPPDTPSLAAGEAMGEALATALGVDGENDVIAAMREKSWLEIEEAARQTVQATPNVDGGHLPDTMRAIFESDEHNDVPLISGMNREDLPHGIDRLIDDMPWMADQFESDVFTYVFGHVMSGWAEEGGVAYHGIELVYLFNNPASAYVHHALGLSGLPEDQPPPALGWGMADMAVADSLMTMWANFAYTGNPSIPEEFEWTPYTSSEEYFLEIGQGGTLGMETGLENGFPLTGVFTDTPVSGLTYQSDSLNERRTGSSGEFNYMEGDTVTFSVGGVALGSVPAGEAITPVDLVPGGSTDHQAVINIARLLQTLDADGDNNNGIQITGAIHDVVASRERNILFDQHPDDFAEDFAVTELIADLNEADVFSDSDPRDRSLKPAAQAKEQLAANLGERVSVETAYGTLMGYGATDSTWQWLGIPYAKPPVGDLRWRPPQTPETWDGVRHATAWSDQAAQDPGMEPFGLGGMSEDCLYLNITAPRDADGLPVMVYFHGGGFRILTGNVKSFNNPTSLPTKDVVLITVNHRLGPMGYLAHPDLSAESDYGGSGNYGQMDLVAALEWIRDNIDAFGGNPDNVTIFGESGGGGKVQHLLASPHAEGLFHKAIMQSGMYKVDTTPLEDWEAQGETLAEALGVANETDVLAAMREIDWTEIVATANGLLPDAEPTVDGWHLPDTVRNIFQAGDHNDVPLISGMNREDFEYLIGVMIDELPFWADHFVSDIYTYVFGHVMTGWAEEGGIAYHGIELIYVFNYPQSAYVHFALDLTELDMTQPMPDLGWGTDDMGVVDDMMTMWSNFAYTGDPGIAGVIDWEPYASDTEAYLKILQGGDTEMREGLDNAFPAFAGP